MPKKHIIRSGDCIASLGFAHGFHPDTLWDDPANVPLHEERASGYVLAPGDVLTIPDLREKECQVATGRRHVYRRRGVPEKLHIQIREDEKPVVNKPYTLEIDGKKRDGTTDGEGRVDEWIPPGAQQGRLEVEGQDPIELQLGSLEPVSFEAGLIARLTNLGFIPRESEPGDVDARWSALRRFQVQHHLPATGDADEATRAKLTEIHES